MSKHTPGPWVVRSLRPAFNTNDLRIWSHSKGPVANIPASYADQEANARLIATAPEMLAALKDLANEITQSGMIDLDDGSETMREINRKRDVAIAAIAKAEGRS